MKKEFSSLPGNVRVIWPKDQVSSYNLAEIADAVLVAWTTIGLELARFGVPGVAAFDGIGVYPTGSFIGFESSPLDYFRAIEAVIKKPASLDKIIEAFRWTHFTFLSPTVDVSDLVPGYNKASMPPRRVPANRDIILRALVENEDISDINMARLPRGATVAASERRAVLEAIDRFICFFMSGTDRNGIRPHDLRLQANGVVSLEINGKVIQRYSPLVHRLAAMVRQLEAGQTMNDVA
jgi:hypothetical protein